MANLQTFLHYVDIFDVCKKRNPYLFKIKKDIRQYPFSVLIGFETNEQNLKSRIN